MWITGTIDRQRSQRGSVPQAEALRLILRVRHMLVRGKGAFIGGLAVAFRLRRGNPTTLLTMARPPQERCNLLAPPSRLLATEEALGECRDKANLDQQADDRLDRGDG